MIITGEKGSEKGGQLRDNEREFVRNDGAKDFQIFDNIFPGAKFDLNLFSQKNVFFTFSRPWKR